MLSHSVNQDSVSKISHIDFNSLIVQVDHSLNAPQKLFKLWNENEIIRRWYLGKPINLGTDNVPYYKMITLAEIKKFFILLLAKRNSDLASLIWNENKIFQQWFCGQAVEFAHGDVKQISLDELLENFNSALTSHLNEITQSMWDQSTLLQDFIKGDDVTISPGNKRKISLLELLNIFKIAIVNQNRQITENIWESNLLLQTYLCGKTNTTTDTEIPKISLEKTLEIFCSLLASKQSHISNVLWDNHQGLRAYFYGETVNFTPRGERSLTLDETLVLFKKVLSSKNSKIINAMWDNNPLLQNYISNRGLNEQIIDIFKAALSSQNHKIIAKIWNSNNLLKIHFSGRTDRCLANNISVISDNKLIENFQSAILSRHVEVLISMWHENIRLHNIVQTCTDETFNTLLAAILKIKSHDFEKLFLKKLNPTQVQIMKNALAERETAPKKTKISEYFKRTNKHQRKGLSLVERSNLIKKLPPPAQLNKKNYFFINEQDGKKIQTRLKVIKETIGIKSITKVKYEKKYKFTISDLTKYTDFHHKTISQEVEKNSTPTSNEFSSSAAGYFHSASAPPVAAVPLSEDKNARNFLTSSSATFFSYSRHAFFESELLTLEEELYVSAKKPT